MSIRDMFNKILGKREPDEFTNFDSETEAELKTVKTQLDTQKAQIEKHFAESAELFKTLISDYQKFFDTI